MLVLIIDDDSEVRRMIGRMLDSEGYDVIEAADGKEGLEVIKTINNIDLLITDLIMPEKEGIEVIREVKKICPEIKILAISGGGRGDAKNYLTIAKAMGAHQTLKKPFIKKELIEKVTEMVE
ncbi:MAG: response regulator [Calditrichaceae bacterium]|jgi:CheY-like chemotaxis protein